MKTIKLVLIGLVVAIQGHCCQCLPLSFDQEIKRSEVIFHGRVIKVVDNTFTFEIIELLKGSVEQKEMRVVQGTSCNRRTFELGTDYIVYLIGMSIGNCSRTHEYLSSVDSEKLDLMFKNLGDKESIESDRLTEREFTTLKNIFDKARIVYPSNLLDLKIVYAFEKSLVDKWTFLENYIWLVHSLRLGKVDDLIKTQERHDEYLIWIGYNSKKSFRSLKKNLRRPSRQQNI